MTATLKEAILLLTICTANLIFSAELGTSPNDVVYACKGWFANLPWKRTNDSGYDTVKDVTWFFHGASSKDMVATFVLGQFFAAPKYVGRASQFEQYGVTLVDVTEGDAGKYSVENVITESNASFLTRVYQSHSMFLQVSDGPMVKRGRLEVTQDPVPLWNTTTQQWTIRLLCGFFTFQGQPPIQVEWIVPGGEVQASSGYTGDHFYLSLFLPLVNAGNYTCRIPHQFYSDACFELKTRGDTTSLTEATTVLDELRVQLVLANVEIKQLRQEKERLQDNVTQHADAMKHQINQMGTTLGEYKSSNEAMKHQINQMGTTLGEDKSSIEAMKHQINQMETTLQEYKSSKEGLKNVALGRPAQQSNPTSFYLFSAEAGKAVDGDRNSDFSENSCTHTQQESNRREWWQVDLGLRYSITSVIITNRGTSDGNRLRDFDVEVHPDNPEFRTMYGVNCFHHNGPMAPGSTQTFTCSKGPITGQFVRILNGAGSPLTLCEVAVMAKPLT